MIIASSINWLFVLNFFLFFLAYPFTLLLIPILILVPLIDFNMPLFKGVGETGGDPCP